MAIQLRNVQFAYPDAPDKLILNINQWSVDQGDRLFVHGPSGGGKSTLLNLLSGMLRCQQGEVSVLDQRLDNMSARKRDKFRAAHIGYVFQRFNLIPYLSALDNILLASQFGQHKKAQAQQDAIHLLNTLNIDATTAHQPTAKLSIGQQQRVAIARALINRPALLIADEPTSSLDQQNCFRFISLLMSLVAEHNTTLLFVSHDLSLAPHFSQQLALSEINQLQEPSPCL